MEALRGRVALVTGASRGIGRATALALAREGVRVAVNHRAAADDAATVVREIEALGGDAFAVGADVASPEAVDEMLHDIGRELGPVDILVSNAGIAKPLPLEAVRLATWDATMAVNLRAPFIVASGVVPGMRERRFGRLVFVSSTAAKVGGIVGPHYAASKAGVEGLAHAYASLLAREGITSNAVAPALIETEMLAGNDKASAERVPVGRLGTPEEVADVIVSVVRNPFITGQTLQVNGGIYMT
ncbi:MAG: SDR family NAD(P)-dependent oxidoreductase [Myxococcales bacterium]|nr:SDR family NAD(P)-dependent oxidoreductase [Myxococcales bacterium]